MRQKMNLDGVWDFGWYGEEKPVFPVKTDEATAVPGCFDVMEPHCGKRGWAVYRRNVEVGGNVKLSIDGMGLYGEVYWDGKLIGECKYAYMPEAFWFDAGEERVHELAVLIDNRHNDVFEPFFDFYGYGGIYGSVDLERVPEQPVTQLLISTEDVETGRIRVRAEASIASQTASWMWRFAFPISVSGTWSIPICTP